MAADVVALGAALVATRIAARPDTTGRRTFGSYRAEVFASGLAVLLMLGVSAYIAVEAIGRIGSTPRVSSGAMLLVGAVGIAGHLAGDTALGGTWLTAALGPTAYVMLAHPYDAQSRARTGVVGHLVALVAGSASAHARVARAIATTRPTWSSRSTGSRAASTASPSSS